jgi:hypothetical protein
MKKPGKQTHRDLPRQICEALHLDPAAYKVTIILERVARPIPKHANGSGVAG